MSDRWDGIDRRRSDRRTHTGSLDLAGAVDGIADRAAEREREACARRIETWGMGLVTEEQRWTAAAAAGIAREASR